jgi:hypothetical protein
MQDEGARAHRHQRLHMLLGLVLDEGHQRRVVHLLARALAAGHEQHVQRRAVLEAELGHHRQALGTTQRLRRLTDEVRAHAAADQAPHAEHFPRADEVEFFDGGEDEDADLHERI